MSTFFSPFPFVISFGIVKCPKYPLGFHKPGFLRLRALFTVTSFTYHFKGTRPRIDSRTTLSRVIFDPCSYQTFRFSALARLFLLDSLFVFFIFPIPTIASNVTIDLIICVHPVHDLRLQEPSFHKNYVVRIIGYFSRYPLLRVFLPPLFGVQDYY